MSFCYLLTSILYLLRFDLEHTNHSDRKMCLDRVAYNTSRSQDCSSRITSENENASQTLIRSWVRWWLLPYMYEYIIKLFSLSIVA